MPRRNDCTDSPLLWQAQPAGGQHVVGAGGVVAEADTGAYGADEDGAGVAHPRGDRGGVAGLDLEVLGGVGVDDVEAGVDVVDEHDAATAVPVEGLRATRSVCLVAATRRASAGLDGVGELARCR